VPDEEPTGVVAPDDGDATPERPRAPLFRAITVGASLLLLLLAVRAYLGARPAYLLGPPESGLELLYDAQLGWRNIPDDVSVTFGRTLTTNSHGLRGPETTRRKPEGTKRILVLGDSFAWGMGVADDDVLTRVLQERLDALPTRWEVLNAAVSGWGTDQQYLYLVQEGFEFEPDVVVLATFLANDHEGNARSRMYQRDKPVFLGLDLDASLANVPVPRPGEGGPELRTEADPLRLTATLVNRIAQECASRGSAFVPMWFGHFMAPRYSAAENAEFREMTEFFRSQIDAAPHVHPLDLDAAYERVGATYDELTRGGADRHWNATGHEISAELLRRHLLDAGLLD
jgi:hypothetical protein